MPLTNAEKQKAHRQRQREKMARYEGALNTLVSLMRDDHSLLAEQVGIIAREGLYGLDES